MILHKLEDGVSTGGKKISNHIYAGDTNDTRL